MTSAGGIVPSRPAATVSWPGFAERTTSVAPAGCGTCEPVIDCITLGRIMTTLSPGLKSVGVCCAKNAPAMSVQAESIERSPLLVVGLRNELRSNEGPAEGWMQFVFG